MPNAGNVDAPITLVGPGRSGTTLITGIFERHSQFSVVGESAHLVWSSYYWLNRWLRNTGPFPGERTLSETARDGVYASLCATYPAAEPHWFHKPIFEPAVHIRFADQHKFRSWYWETSRELFPRGRFLTVLRDPATTAASTMQRWDNTEEQAFTRIRRVYELMLHPASRVELVLRFDDLQQRPEETVRRLMAFAGVSFEPAQMTAFDWRYVPNTGERPTGLKVPAAVQDLYEQLLDRAERSATGALRP